MSKITLAPNASGTGTLTIAAPNTNSDYTLTLPAETGTVLTSASTIIQNGGPAFSAYRSGSTQLVSNTTWTKVQFNAELFDTNSCFDSSTNYRFTPNVAGYYQVNTTLNTNYSTLKRVLLGFYKNGSLYLAAVDLDSVSAAGSSFNEVSGSTLVYMNGTTDYLEVYVYLNGTTDGSTLGVYYGATFTQFSGYLARAA